MDKVKLIIWREYLTRIRKRSFLVMTIVGPLLMAGLMIIPIYLSIKDVDVQLIQVIDETGAFEGEFQSTSTVLFDFSEEGIIQAKHDFYDMKYTCILYIPKNAYSAPGGIRLFHKKQPGQKTINYINNTLGDVIERDRLKVKFDISQEELKAVRPSINVMTISLDETGKEEKTYALMSTLLGFGGAILIYFFIFLFGVQVMRGVIEEKTNRIIEVIISSIKPFQLMLGKIVGIALVGLTQFLLWIILTFILMSLLGQLIPDELQQNISEAQRMEEFIPENESKTSGSDSLLVDITTGIKMINFPLIIFSFLFYFLGGYLLYGALFAAVGSAVDSEADTQQFMLPITVPLVLAFVLAQSVIQNPDGLLAWWLSVIPFTSPVIMMVRIPFGVTVAELIISMTTLIMSFILITWLAGKIYRTGILMYGKKTSYKELWKWLFYKD